MATLTFPISAITILSIPTYYILTLSAHVYGTTFATARIPGGRKALDAASPRANNTQIYQKALAPRDFATVERAKAAHANGHENFPLYLAAVFAGTVVGLGVKEVERFAIVTIVGRALYNVFYIGAERRKYAPLRSLCWTVTTGWALTTLVRAGLKVWNEAVV